MPYDLHSKQDLWLDELLCCRFQIHVDLFFKLSEFEIKGPLIIDYYQIT